MTTEYERILIDLIGAQNRALLLQPLILGGTGGSGGGSGGPAGGIIGQLPQTVIAFDTTEAATDATMSGSSLLDNLNHIRYLIDNITISGGSPGGGGHTIEDEGIALAQRAGLNFKGNYIVVTDDSGDDRTEVTMEDIPYVSSGVAPSPVILGELWLDLADSTPPVVISGTGGADILEVQVFS